MTKLDQNDVEVTEDEVDTIFALGANFFSQGKYQKAKIIFAGLMALDDSDEKSAIAYGESLMRAMEHERAWRHFVALSERFNESSRVSLWAAKCAMLLNKFDQALDFVTPIISNEAAQPANVWLEARAIYLWLMKRDECI